MKKRVFTAFLILAFRASASQLPVSETFEVSNGVTNGTINGQNGWVVASGTANVQSSIVQSGSQALEVQSGTVTHALSNNGMAVRLSFQARITAIPETDPEVTNANTSVAFFVNTNLNIVVYSNQTPVTLACAIQTNTWTRFDVYCDYNSKQWSLNVDGTPAAQNLGLYSENTQLESVLIANNSAAPAYFDELAAEDADDTDGDGMPDWWELCHFGGITNANAECVSSNGMTYFQCYVAGLTPDNSEDMLALNKQNGRKFNWARKPGRLYDIYWTTNLASGFTCIRPSIATDEFEDTDVSRTQKPAGFYQIRVRK
jgi:hypothetical protein